MKKILSFLILLPQFLFSQKITTKACIVGISSQQDSALQPFAVARRDAEEFAAFLQSKSGGSLERDQILLLSDQEATLARFAAALDWLFEEKSGAVGGIRRVLYFGGIGQIITSERKKDEDALLFFHDSPAAPLQGNTISLVGLRKLFERSGESFALVASFKVTPTSRSGNPTPPRPGGRGYIGEGKNRKSIFLKCQAAAPTDSAAEKSHREKTISNDWVGGLLGLADLDGDLKIKGSEILNYLKNQQPTSAANPSEFFYLALPNQHDELSKVDENTLEEIRRLGSSSIFPPIVRLESMPAEDRVLRTAPPAALAAYEDFILAIKLKNFLPPPAEHNALDLYECLRRDSSAQPIIGHLRRRLAAAMLDETQQALNDYLNASAKELARRRKNSQQYKRYAQLLQQANELLGSRHYLHKTLQAKQLYFEGLSLRLEFLNSKDSTLLPISLEKQAAALRAEPEAAYIYNELGVLQLNLKHPAEAEKQFLKALEFSPTWGIPYANLCLLALNSGDWTAANNYGIKAVSLAPWNPDAYAILGFVHKKKEDWAAVEKLFRRAVKLGTNLPEVFYDLACLAARKNETDAALGYLQQAFENGFDDARTLENDPDLFSIRKNERFLAMLEQYYFRKN